MGVLQHFKHPIVPSMKFYFIWNIYSSLKLKKLIQTLNKSE